MILILIAGQRERELYMLYKENNELARITKENHRMMNRLTEKNKSSFNSKKMEKEYKKHEDLKRTISKNHVKMGRDGNQTGIVLRLTLNRKEI
jgi:hypothetical protein